MRPGWVVLLALLALLAVLALQPAPARAWTEARIETAAAHVDVLGERVLVSLELGVRVDGGWLTRLELRGLEPGLVLDAAKPPYVLCEDGRKVAPTVRRDDGGQLVLSFPDQRSAPRRGRHRLGLVYQAPLSTVGTAGAAPASVWSLPAFLHDLREARIELRAPAGSTPLPREHDSTGAVTVRSDDRHASLALHARHVPRGTPLELAFSRPSSAPGTSMAPTAVGSHAAPRAELAAVALCALLLSVLKRRAASRLAAEHGARALPLVRLPGGARQLASLALCAAFAASYASAPEGALLALVLTVALSLDRRFERSPRTAPAPWPRGAALVVALGRARRARAARLLGARAWLDATTPAGAALLGSGYALALTRGVFAGAPDVWLEALLVVTPLFVTATRLQLPTGRHDALITHLRAARALRRHRIRATRSEAPRSDPREGGAPTGF